MTAFVTGASGFVGGALAADLVSTGIAVRAAVRSDAAALAVDALGAEAVSVAIDDRKALAEAMHGCRVVFHVAGVNTICPRDPAAMYRVNVDATRTVVNAAADAGVDRVVVTSSASAIGEREGEVGTESTPHSGHFLSHYARSKKLGEDAAFEEGRRRGTDVVAVLPSSVQGPGRTGGSARLLLYAARSRRPVVFDTTLSFVDVADCTRGHRLAAERGVAGERYLLSGATLSVGDAIRALESSVGITIEPRFVPRAAVRAAGAALLPLRRMVGDVCPEMVATLLHGHRFDGAHATRALGLSYTPIADTFVRSVRWYREQGLISIPS